MKRIKNILRNSWLGWTNNKNSVRVALTPISQALYMSVTLRKGTFWSVLVQFLCVLMQIGGI